MNHVYAIAAIYGLGFAFVAAAWINHRRIREDKLIIADWYQQVVHAMSEAEKSADVAKAAASRATKIVNGTGIPAPTP